MFPRYYRAFRSANSVFTLRSSSIRHVLFAINTFFSSSQHDPDTCSLFSDLHHTLTEFVNTHSDTDASASKQLHDGLLAIYQQFIVPKVRSSGPEELGEKVSTDGGVSDDDEVEDSIAHLKPFSGLHNSFITILAILCPVLKSSDNILFWWNQVIIPAVDCPGLRPLSVLKDARHFIHTILFCEDGPDPLTDRDRLSQVFLRTLIDAYMIRSKIWSPFVPPHVAEEAHLIRELEMILATYAAKRPKVCERPYQFSVFDTRVLTTSCRTCLFKSTPSLSSHTLELKGFDYYAHSSSHNPPALPLSWKHPSSIASLPPFSPTCPA